VSPFPLLLCSSFSRLSLLLSHLPLLLLCSSFSLLSHLPSLLFLSVLSSPLFLLSICTFTSSYPLILPFSPTPLLSLQYDSGDEGPGEVGGDGQPRGVLHGGSSHGPGLCLGGHQLPGSRIHRDLPGNASPVGLVLTVVVAISYQVAIIFEGPFTEDIYRQRAQCCKHK
uniref:Uncharacterized protein n=1 Tax=Oncorhynchus tshawytscha TaxID=74940 RepID=A0AAZ3SFG2_ONCTS